MRSWLPRSCSPLCSSSSRPVRAYSPRSAGIRFGKGQAQRVRALAVSRLMTPPAGRSPRRAGIGKLTASVRARPLALHRHLPIWSAGRDPESAGWRGGRGVTLRGAPAHACARPVRMLGLDSAGGRPAPGSAARAPRRCRGALCARRGAPAARPLTASRYQEISPGGTVVGVRLRPEGDAQGRGEPRGMDQGGLVQTCAGRLEADADTDRHQDVRSPPRSPRRDWRRRGERAGRSRSPAVTPRSHTAVGWWQSV